MCKKASLNPFEKHSKLHKSVKDYIENLFKAYVTPSKIIDSLYWPRNKLVIQVLGKMKCGLQPHLSCKCYHVIHVSVHTILSRQQGLHLFPWRSNPVCYLWANYICASYCTPRNRWKVFYALGKKDLADSLL